MANNQLVEDMRAFYRKNSDFKRYIDMCCSTYGKDVEAMLKLRITESYYQSLQKGGCNCQEKKHE